MTLEVFNPPVRPMPGIETKPKVNLFEISFGDGYTQEMPNGLNHIQHVAKLRWDGLTMAQKQALDTFFESKGGYIAFGYQPYGFPAQLKWLCKDWGGSNGAPFTYEATLTEFFTFETVAGGSPTVAPTLDLDFVNKIYRKNGWLRDLADISTFTRSTTAPYFDIAGTQQTAAINALRFGYNPVTHANLGLITERNRTNMLLNSTTLSTQTVTGLSSGFGYVLSFTGTGSIAVSGTAGLSGTLAGTDINNRVYLAFIAASAGTAIFTVTGDVRMAQFEVTAFGVPTSWIPTTSATVFRANEIFKINNNEGWWKNIEGTWIIEGLLDYADMGATIQAEILTHSLDASNYHLLRANASGTIVGQWRTAIQSTTGAFSSIGGTHNDISPGMAAPFRVGYTWSSSEGIIYRQGGTPRTWVVNAPLPALNSVDPQFFLTGSGSLKRIQFIPQKVDAATLQALVG